MERAGAKQSTALQLRKACTKDVPLQQHLLLFESDVHSVTAGAVHACRAAVWVVHHSVSRPGLPGASLVGSLHALLLLHLLSILLSVSELLGVVLHAQYQ